MNLEKIIDRVATLQPADMPFPQPDFIGEMERNERVLTDSDKDFRRASVGDPRSMEERLKENNQAINRAIHNLKQVKVLMSAMPGDNWDVAYDNLEKVGKRLTEALWFNDEALWLIEKASK